MSITWVTIWNRSEVGSISFCYMAIRNKDCHTTLCHISAELEMGCGKAQGKRRKFQAASEIISFWQVYCFMQTRLPGLDFQVLDVCLCRCLSCSTEGLLLRFKYPRMSLFFCNNVTPYSVLVAARKGNLMPGCFPPTESTGDKTSELLLKLLWVSCLQK